MSLSSNNNKETFKLLDVSSETDSDILPIEIAPRKRRLNRTRRGRGQASLPHTWKERWGPRAVALAASAALLAWLAALSWAAAALAADTHRLDAALREVSMGSQSVGDALQRCHSAAKELLHNHTEMAARLDQLVLQTDNLTAQVKVLHSGLSEVRSQVAGAPELVAVPQQLDDLQASVARFGSQLRDMDSTVSSLKSQASGQEDLNRNVSDLKSQVSRLWNKTLSWEPPSNSRDLEPLVRQQAELQSSFTQLSGNVTQVNATLTSMINWATQDYNKDHHKVEGLLESVQNNSAALSSLQTAWRQGNDILAKNITDLSQQIADKSAEFQRRFIELKQLQEQLAATQAKLVSNAPSPSPPSGVPSPENSPSPAALYASPSPADAVKSEEQMKLFHERGLENILIPKNMVKIPPTLMPAATKAPLHAVRAATGKPNILSAGGA